MDATTAPLPVSKLEALGDPDAAACEGDSCAIPDRHTQAVVSRSMDDDEV